MKHKVNDKIECYPKSLLIFIAYQVQGWCTMILSPVKSQPNESNVKETAEFFAKKLYPGGKF